MRIAIPQPCHEDWNKMNPVEKGAFCRACQKVVRDFSNDSEKEITEYLLKHKGEKVCGRFAASQVMPNVKLEVDLQTMPSLRNPFRIFACAVFLVFGASLFRSITVNGENVNAVEWRNDTLPAQEAALVIPVPQAPPLASEIPDPSGVEQQNVSTDSVHHPDTVSKDNPTQVIITVVTGPITYMGPAPYIFSWDPPVTAVALGPTVISSQLQPMLLGWLSCPVPLNKDPLLPDPFSDPLQLPSVRVEEDETDEHRSQKESQQESEDLVIKPMQALTDENKFPAAPRDPAG